MLAPKNKPCFVGLDVSKATVDVCVLPGHWRWQVENNGNFSDLIEKLQVLSPHLVVLEPTGGHEKSLLKAIFKAGIPVSRQHALRIHHHAKSRGKHAKTDPIDAETIAHYAQCYANEISPLEAIEEEQEAFQQLVARREDLVKIRTAEKNRLKSPGLCEAVKLSCQSMLEQLDSHIEALSNEIQAHLASEQSLLEKKALLLSVPGIGETIANGLLAYLPELGTIGHKQLAALVGVAPFQHSSGQYRGEQHIAGGRMAVRCLLYMAMMSAIRFNPVLAPFYKRLRDKGKKPKVAIIACLHKLLRIVNAMIAKGEKFQAA